MDTAVSHDIPSLSEASLADITRERTLTSVAATVYPEVSAARESFSTNLADVWPLTGVLPCVLLQIAFVEESDRTLEALEWADVVVSFRVLLQCRF